MAQAFGFDLTPLVVRSAEFERLADEVRTETKARQLLREEISLHRRDLSKMLAFAFDQALAGPWRGLADRFYGLGAMPPRSAECALLTALVAELRLVRLEADKWLSDELILKNSSPNESHLETHHQNSKTDDSAESEAGIRQGRADDVMLDPEAKRTPQRAYPLGMVMQACPDIALYARHGITGWADLATTSDLVRRTLGVSPSAWEDAKGALGEEQACVVIACILQKGTAINSAGAYLRKLTDLAKAGKFSLGPMLMALMPKTAAGERGRLRA